MHAQCQPRARVTLARYALPSTRTTDGCSYIFPPKGEEGNGVADEARSLVSIFHDGVGAVLVVSRPLANGQTNAHPRTRRASLGLS